MAGMHSQTNTPQSLESRPAVTPHPHLAITDAMALFAIRDQGDEAAGAWLRYKYRPFVAHIARRHFAGAQCVDTVVEESLRRAMELLATDRSAESAAPVFARAALQHCFEITRDGQGDPSFRRDSNEEHS